MTIIELRPGLVDALSRFFPELPVGDLTFIEEDVTDPAQVRSLAASAKTAGSRSTTASPSTSQSPGTSPCGVYPAGRITSARSAWSCIPRTAALGWAARSLGTH